MVRVPSERIGKALKRMNGIRMHQRRLHVPLQLVLSLVAIILSGQASLSFASVAETDANPNKNSIETPQQNLLRTTVSAKHRQTEDAAWSNSNDDVTNYVTDDAIQNAESTFLDMFYTSPSTWSPLEWGIFAGMLTLFGIIFFCWCLVCIIPQCCGHRAAALAYATL